MVLNDQILVWISQLRWTNQSFVLTLVPILNGMFLENTATIIAIGGYEWGPSALCHSYPADYQPTEDQIPHA